MFSRSWSPAACSLLCMDAAAPQVCGLPRNAIFMDNTDVGPGGSVVSGTRAATVGCNHNGHIHTLLQTPPECDAEGSMLAKYCSRKDFTQRAAACATPSLWHQLPHAHSLLETGLPDGLDTAASRTSNDWGSHGSPKESQGKRQQLRRKQDTVLEKSDMPVPPALGEIHLTTSERGSLHGSASHLRVRTP